MAAGIDPLITQVLVHPVVRPAAVPERNPQVAAYANHLGIGRHLFPEPARKFAGGPVPRRPVGMPEVIAQPAGTVELPT